MNMTHAKIPALAVQKGAMTLLMATVLLLAVSMVGVYSTRSSVVDQRVTANTVWSATSSSVVKTAMDDVSGITQSTMKSLAGSKTNLIFTSKSLSSTSIVAVDKNNSAIDVPNNTDYTTTVTSTDGFATATIEVAVTGPNNVAAQKSVTSVMFAPYLKELPKAGVAAKGTIAISKSDDVKISNASIYASTQTATKNICPKKAAMLAKINTSTSTASTSSIPEKRISAAVIPKDYFSDSLSHIRDVAEHYINCAGGCDKGDVNNLTGTIWVEGNLTLDGGTLGDFGQKNKTDNDAGVDSKPVLLFVTGTLKLKGNAVVNGLICTLGNWSNGTGTATVNGAILVGGHTSVTGDFSSDDVEINHQFNILVNVQKLGRYAQIPGTWRDF